MHSRGAHGSPSAASYSFLSSSFSSLFHSHSTNLFAFRHFKLVVACLAVSIVIILAAEECAPGQVGQLFSSPLYHSAHDNWVELFGRNGSSIEAQRSESSVNKDLLLDEQWRWARNVSVVYTFVNGSEPEHKARYEAHGGKVGGERDRDNGEFRYSFRSLSQHMPWHTGMVYLVSPKGHIPPWLDTSNPRFQWIDQDKLIPEEDQPTFNSNVIEQLFHLIPGISERFIIMNDDYFLSHYTHPSAFFTAEGGIKFFLQEWAESCSGCKQWPPGEDQWSQSIRHTHQVINQAYQSMTRNSGRIPSHAPFVRSRKAYEGMHQRFYNQLSINGRHKHRAPDDVIIPMLHNEWVMQEGGRSHGVHYEIVESQALFLEWHTDGDKNQQTWTALEEANPTFFNINDAMGFAATTDAAAAQLDLQRRLEEKYPARSEFELV